MLTSGNNCGPTSDTRELVKHVMVCTIFQSNVEVKYGFLLLYNKREIILFQNSRNDIINTF